MPRVPFQKPKKVEWELLSDRYIMYGEWCYGRHTIFYTDLPHYFLEFDLLDTQTHTFLSTERRRLLLQSALFIASVPVLSTGSYAAPDSLRELIGPSRWIAPDHREQLADAAREAGLDPAQALAESDPSGLMEGLYIKIEEDGVVTDRYKYVRRGFLQTVLDSGSHWADRPLLPNRLHPGASLW